MAGCCPSNKYRKIAPQIEKETPHPHAHVSILPLPDGTTIRYGSSLLVACPAKPLPITTNPVPKDDKYDDGDHEDESGEEKSHKPATRAVQQSFAEGYFVHPGPGLSNIPAPRTIDNAPAEPLILVDPSGRHGVHFATQKGIPAHLDRIVSDHVKTIEISLLAGVPGVGRTCLLTQFVEGRFQPKHFPTVSSLVREKHFTLLDSTTPVFIRVTDTVYDSTPRWDDESILKADAYVVGFSGDKPGSLDKCEEILGVLQRVSLERNLRSRERLRYRLGPVLAGVAGITRKKKGKKGAEDTKSLMDKYSFMPPIFLACLKKDTGGAVDVKKAEGFVETYGLSGLVACSSKDNQDVELFMDVVCRAVLKEEQLRNELERAMMES